MTKVVDSKLFQTIVFTVITVNAIVLGIETTPWGKAYGGILDAIDNFCLCVFVVELLMRIVARRAKFFVNPWNLFDLLVVIVPIVASGMMAVSSLRVMRLLRQFKAMRLVSSVRTMQIIVNAIFRSIPSLGYAGLLMLVVLYIYSVIGCNLYGELDAFSGMGSAMLTLIVTTTFEGWGDLLYDLMGISSWSWVYLVSFVIVSALIMLNIVVGIVVNFVSESYESKNENELGDVEKELAEVQKHFDLLKKELSRQRN